MKAFGRLAEIMGEYLKKGRQVYIEGSLRTEKYTDKNGVEKYSTDIIADEMQMLGGMGEGGGGGGQRGGGERSERPARPSGGGGGGGGDRGGPRGGGGGDYGSRSGGGSSAPPSRNDDPFPDDDIPF